jgi:homoserine O-succinyltransferase
MPISVDSDDRTSGLYERSSGSITIGLINNMPDSALEATERQFMSLLNTASEGMHIRLERYMVPEVPRRDAAQRYLDAFYTSVDYLWDRPLDGLIVTGREPLVADLKDEPYWKTLASVVDWAQENTSPQEERQALRHFKLRTRGRSSFDSRRTIASSTPAFTLERRA